MKVLMFSLFFLFPTTFLSAQSWKTDLQKADSLTKKRDFEGAIALYEQVLPLIEKDSSRKSEVYLKARNGLGSAIVSIKSKGEAETFLLESVELAKKFGRKSLVYASSLNSLANFYYNTVNYASAEPLYKEILDIRKEVLGEKHLDCAASMNNLANVKKATEKFADAESLYLSALTIRKNALGEKHLDYIQVLNNLGVLYWQIGDYPKAESFYLKCAELRKEILGAKHSSYASVINNLGVLYESMGNYTKSEKLHKENLDIRKSIADTVSIEYIYALNNLAGAYMLQCNYLLAEKNYSDAMKIYIKLYSTKNLEYAILLNNLAVIAYMTGYYTKAERFYIESKTIRKELLGEKNLDYAQSLYNLADLYVYTEKYAAAKPLFEESMKIRKDILGENNSLYAASLERLGNMHEEMGHFSVAEKLFKESLNIYAKTLGENNINYAISLNSLAYLYANMHRYDSSALLQKKCLQLQSDILGKDNHFCIQSISNLAFIDWASGNRTQAVTNYKLIKDWSIARTENTLPYMNETQKEDFYQDRLQKYIKNYMGFAVEMPQINTKELYDLQLSTKAVLMQAAQKVKTRILNSGDTSLIRKYQDWNQLKNQIMKAEEMNETTRQEKGINLDYLVNQNEYLEKEISRESAAFASLTDKKRTTWQDIQKTLKKGEAAIEIAKINKYGLAKIVTDTSDVAKAPNFPQYPIYGLTDTVYYAALIVKKNSKEPEIILLKNGNALEKEFVLYQKNAIQYTQEDLISYDQFWLPIAQKLKGIKKVFFSPDGIYNQISLNTLQNPKTKKFVLDEIELHLVTNTKDILAFGKSENKTLKAELLGYPLYDLQTQNADAARMREVLADSTRAFANFQQVSLLPGTKKEVETIYEILNKKNYQTKVLMEKNATEENIKKIKNPKVLHLSTHGFFIDSKEKNEKVNPMLRSGLLLTGVSDYTRAEMKPDVEDGILTALEAANLDLDETDLVVLSACETGLGDVKAGEGVYGLQRAFKVAGAKSIVMSMWKVDDAVTQKLMTTFYQKFAESNKARQAFKEAQAIIKKQHPEPYYWGAFVMVGE